MASTKQRKSKKRENVPLDETELAAAFRFLDPSGEGRLTAEQLKERTSFFFPSLSERECKMLVGEANSLSLDELRALLLENELGDFDPVAEAFSMFQADDAHEAPSSPSKAAAASVPHASIDMIASVMETMKLGPITAEDRKILLQAADVDGDGVVSLSDFARMLQYDYHPPKLFPDADEIEKQAAAGASTSGAAASSAHK